MVRKFSFCYILNVDVLAKIYLLHIFIDLKTVFISWNMILKLKSFIQIGTRISHKKILTPHVAVYLLDETWYSASIYHLVTQLWRCNTQKYSLGESIFLAKSKDYTLLYISDKFHRVWMTTIFLRSVFYRSLSLFYSTYWCYIHQSCTNCSSWHGLLMPHGSLCPWPTFHTSVTKTQNGNSGPPVMVPISIISSCDFLFTSRVPWERMKRWLRLARCYPDYL